MNYNKLIENVKKEHLCSVTFKRGEYSNTKEPFTIITIKKQIGNTGGAIIEIDFEEKEKVLDIRFKPGSYNSFTNIKDELSVIFDLINIVENS